MSDEDTTRDHEPLEAVGSPQPLPAVRRDDILRGEKLLRPVLDLLRLDRLRGWLWLAALIVVPLAVFVGVTHWEDRFWLGHVTGNAEQFGARKVRGMSFFGDSMVWPFVILIPVLFGLLNLAIGRFEQLFSSIAPLLRRWLADPANTSVYRRIVDDARQIASGGPRWSLRWSILRWRNWPILPLPIFSWRILSWVAVAIGLSLFAYNAVTCTFPERFEPYTTRAPFVERNGEARTGTSWDFGAIVPKSGEVGPYVQIPYKQPIAVAKWDTDFWQGRKSWLAARLWVLLLGYFWIPVAVYKLLILGAATYRFTDWLARQPGALDVRPLAPDDAGGLGSLASLSLALTYPMVVLSTMLVLPFFKENASASLHDLLFFVPFVPVFVAMFFVPLLAIHRAMQAAKAKCQRGIADLCEEVHEAFLREVRRPTGNDGKELSRLQLAMKGLTESLERAKAMPVWPFETSTIYRLITAGLLPVVVPWLIHFALGKLLP